MTVALRVRRLGLRTTERGEVDRSTMRRALGRLRPVLPGLLPSAVLCVRRLKAESPIELRDDGSPVAPLQGWFEQVELDLRSEFVRAVRPADRHPPSDCNAVMFRDRAEALFCLLEDWCAGRTFERWWWSSLFPELMRGRPVEAILADEAMYVPAAIAALVDRRGAQTLLSRLDEIAARRVLRSVAALHGVSSAVLEPSSPNASTSAAPPSAPWSDLIDEPTGADATTLVGISLLLRRRPRIARSIATIEAIQRWRAAQPRTPPTIATPIDRGSLAHGAPSPKAERTTVEQAKIELGGEQVEPLDRSSEERSTRADPRVLRRPVARVIHDPAHGQPRSPTSLLDASIEAPKADPDRIVPKGEWWMQSTASASARNAPDATVVRTNLGGVFFLLNVGIRLGLYGDFTVPEPRKSSMYVWDFVELVARGLLDETPEDPIWSLLASFADRDGPPSTTPSFEADVRPAVTTFLHAQLDQERLADRLLSKSATAYVTPAHLDVAYSLDRLSIDVRVAGLDRDPGWVPAVGRTVRFHFE